MFCTARRGSLISLVLMLCSRFCVRTSWLRCWNCTAGCSTAFTFMMMDTKPTSALASRLRPNGRPRLASSSPSAPPRRLLHFFAFLLAMASFHSRDSRVVAPLLWDLPRAARGTQCFDLCRYKPTHVCSTIRLGIDEMKLTSLVDKESRKRSSTLREKKKKRTTGKGCTGSVALSSLKSMGTPTPTWARVGRRWLDVGRQVTRVVTTTTSRFASASRTPPGPAAAAVREASRRRGYLSTGCALAAATDSPHHHHEKSFESLGLSGSILEALNEIGEHPPLPLLSLSLCSV